MEVAAETVVNGRTACRYVFFEAPLKVNFRNFAKYLLGTSDQTKMVAFDRERPGRWMLVPRCGDDGEVVYIDTPPQFIFHYAAAVETAEGGPLTAPAPPTGKPAQKDVLRK